MFTMHTRCALTMHSKKTVEDSCGYLRLQKTVTDFNIRFTGTDFVEIGLVFVFDGLFSEQCKAMLFTSGSAESANHDHLLTQPVSVCGSGTRLVPATSE